MTRRRWIADVVDGNRAELRGENAAHLSRVLRAKVGQEFEVTAEGKVRLGRIADISAERVIFELGEVMTEASVPAVELTLVLAIYKYDRLEWAIEKLTELNVARIVPVISRRTDSHLASSAQKRSERWRRIAFEAAQQSRRAAPPDIADPIPLKQAVAEVRSPRIVLAETEKGITLKAALRHLTGPVTLAIGPEGGWTEDEMHSFTGAGWQAASLGPTILRAETAAIVAAALSISELS